MSSSCNIWTLFGPFLAPDQNYVRFSFVCSWPTIFNLFIPRPEVLGKLEWEGRGNNSSKSNLNLSNSPQLILAYSLNHINKQRTVLKVCNGSAMVLIPFAHRNWLWRFVRHFPCCPSAYYLQVQVLIIQSGQKLRINDTSHKHIALRTIEPFFTAKCSAVRICPWAAQLVKGCLLASALSLTTKHWPVSSHIKLLLRFLMWSCFFVWLRSVACLSMVTHFRLVLSCSKMSYGTCFSPAT